MHLTTTLEELTEAQLLDHADEVARTQRECEAQVLRIAVQVAIHNHPDRLDPEVSKLPGRERARRFGGVGTPEVSEFAAAALGARLGISTGSAHSLMADALELVSGCHSCGVASRRSRSSVLCPLRRAGHT